MEKCENCNLHKYAINQCKPKGTNNPMIYFVGEAPGPDENKQGLPFVGRAGQYLHSMIELMGLNENNCRFWNAVLCYPQKSDEDTGFRAPTDEELNICKVHLFKDIEETNPKVIVTLGASALKALCPEVSGGITKNRGNMYKFQDNFIIVPTYHPSYLMRNQDPARRMEFKSDIKLAMKIAMENESSNNVDEVINKNTKKLKDNESNTVIITNYNDFDKFCKEEIDNYNMIAYDVETNAKEVTSVEHRIVGFSLASNEKTGCYVPLKALDFEIDEDSKRKIEERMKEFIKKKNMLVYNCQHEMPVTLNWLDTEIENIDDVFVMVKLMMGNADRYQGNGGLKVQCVEHLDSKDWSEDLDVYFNLLKHYSEEDNKIKMRNLLSKYYEGNELEKVIGLVEDLVFDILPPKIPDSYVLSYEYVPYKLIGRYGSIDSSVLFELKDFYDKWMDEEGKKLGIDLHKGYRYWMEHHIAGYILERNGVYWNDEKAQKVESWCTQGMHDSLKELVVSPLSEEYIKSKLEPEFYSMLKDNFVEEILGNDYIIKRMYRSSIHVIPDTDRGKEKLDSLKLVPNDKGIYKIELEHLKLLARKFLKDKPQLFENWYRNYMRNYSKEDHTIEDYKKLLNPTATAKEFKDFVSDILVTDDIKRAKSYMNLVELTEESNYDINNYSRFETDKEIMDIVEESKKISDSRVDPEKLDLYLDKMKDVNLNKIGNPRIYKALVSANTYKLEKLDAGVMNEIYDLYIMCHMDVENSETWSKQFKWLFNYKLFKKYAKILSTYINGKVGRNNVWYVDKKSLERGNALTRREKLYDKDYVCPPDKAMLLNAGFRVNMAETGRWQAGIHNVPAGEVIKGIFTSRFPGGTIACPDGSQMEVRTMAAQSGDEHLLQAFKDGLDIHRFFASKIYKVDYDKVEKWQRGLAKNAVFGILYGESIKAFADSYLKGDMVGAQKIFDDMFDGFPKIKDYIDRAHNQYKKFKKVTSLTQRFIDLTNRPALNRDGTINENTMLRKAQNYPIQAGAEDIAGIIMYELAKFIKENNFKSKIFCFIHDSIEIDMHPMELFPLVDKINYLFNVFPLQEFNVPVATDIPLGPSMGQECEIEEFEHSDDFNDNTLILDGYIDDIEELIGIWKTVYKLVEVSDEFKDEDKDEYITYAKMMLPKKAQLSMYAGKTRKKGKRKIHVIVK